MIWVMTANMQVESLHKSHRYPKILEMASRKVHPGTQVAKLRQPRDRRGKKHACYWRPYVDHFAMVTAVWRGVGWIGVGQVV